MRNMTAAEMTTLSAKLPHDLTPKQADMVIKACQEVTEMAWADGSAYQLAYRILFLALTEESPKVDDV